MNTAIRIIASSGQGNIILSTDDALSCLSTLINNVKETVTELHRIGMLNDENIIQLNTLGHEFHMEPENYAMA